MGDLKDFLKRQLVRVPVLDRLLRRAFLRRKIRATGHPDWSSMLSADAAAWEEARRAARSGRRVLVASSVGANFGGSHLETLLGIALTLRGAEVEFLLCDEKLPACMMCEVALYPRQQHFVRNGPSKDLCLSCYSDAARVYGSLGLQVHTYGSFLEADDHTLAETISASVPVPEIPGYCHEGLAVGEHALAGALRFYARANIDDEPYGAPILRRYFRAAILTALMTRCLIRARRYEVAVFNHGIYVPQGLIGEVCRQEGTRVVNWNPAYRKRCFLFSHGDTYHHTLMSEPTEKWEGLPFTPELEKQILEYLESRWHGTQDWIWFHERPQADMAAIAREIGVDFSRPCIGLLTNVMWDAQLHYPANAFRDMREWVMETIRYFAGRPELQLLIRVHPAEIRGTVPSRQPILEEIRSEFPALPPNVFVIPPESQVSTYAAMDRCNAVVIYGTKTGVELTSMGIPVIVAGEAWIRNKGVTLDARSVEEYRKLLDRLPLAGRMDEPVTRRSRLYAYHFFFRRMIPVDAMQPATGHPPYRAVVDRLSDLAPGKSPGLDVICEGILDGSDFIFRAEQQPTSVGTSRAP